MSQPPDPAEIEARLDRGEWLRVGDVAALLNTSRWSVDRLLRSGAIGHRKHGGRGWRELDPVDVRRELDNYRRVHRGSAADSDDSGPASDGA
jgi:hypothetical protein